MYQGMLGYGSVEPICLNLHIELLPYNNPFVIMLRKATRSALHKLFVYGSLKRGEAKNSWLRNPSNGYAKYLCDAATTQKMPLVIATRYNIPFLLHKPGHGNYVAGEIYDVDDRMMDRLEEVEGANLLRREKQEMNMGLQEG